VIARLYVRLRMIRNVGWDVSCRLNIQKVCFIDRFHQDYMMLGAMALVGISKK
jgi:hypothetical protein